MPSNPRLLISLAPIAGACPGCLRHRERAALSGPRCERRKMGAPLFHRKNYSKKKARSQRPGPLYVSTSEKQLHSQRNAPNPAAKQFLVQEIRIKWQRVSRSSRRCGHSSIAEHVTVAQAVVGMVED